MRSVATSALSRFAPGYAAVRHCHARAVRDRPRLSRRALPRPRTVVMILAVSSALASGQTGTSWHVAVGAGGITGEPFGHGAALLGDFGRTVYAKQRVRVDADLTAGWLTTGSRVCLDGAVPSCDLRELADFRALSLAGVASVPIAAVTPYVRATVGAWQGHDVNGMADQSVRESGVMFSGEGGIRLRRIELGLDVYALSGARRNAIHLITLTSRARW